MIPTVTFDLGYFIELGQLPPLQLFLRVFLDGGWIFFVYMAIMIGWHYFMEWRQDIYAESIGYSLLAIDIPMENEQTPKAVEQIFNQIAGSKSRIDAYEKYWLGKFTLTISFEIVSIDGYVQFLVHTPTKYRDLVEAAIYAQYPDAETVEVADYTQSAPHHFPDPEWQLFGTEFVLKKPNPYPIKTYTDFEHNLSGDLYFKDPIGAFLEPMSQLKRGEQLWIQFLLVPIDDEWKKSADPIVNKLTGRPDPAHKPGIIEQIVTFPLKAVGLILSEIFGGGGDSHAEKKTDDTKILKVTPAEKNLLEKMESKVSKVCFQTKIRLVYLAKRDLFNMTRFSAIKGAFNQFGSSSLNSFGGYGPVTPQADYFWQRWHTAELQHHLMKYYASRSNKGGPPIILSTEELATIYHFPYKQIKAPLVKKSEAKRAEPPSSLPTTDQYDSPFRKGSIAADKAAGHGKHGAHGGHGKASDKSEHAADEHKAEHKEPKHEEKKHVAPKHDTHEEELPPPAPVHSDEDEEDGFVPPNLPVV